MHCIRPRFSAKCLGLNNRERNVETVSVCQCKGCDLPVKASGLCSEHLRRARKSGSPFEPKMNAAMFRGRSAIERFEAQHKKTEGCWLWTYCVDRQGYGRFDGIIHGVRYTKAHRFSFALHSGKPVPPDKLVCHTCDNPTCVNPAHLWLGTVADNHADMNRKGRRHDQSGENSHLAQLNEEKVRKILSDSRTYAEIAADYGVAATTITSIKNRVSWAHVEVSHIAKNPRGGAHRRGIGSKITEEIVREIRKSIEQGKILAQKYGISNVLVSNIRRRKVWKHVTD